MRQRRVFDWICRSSIKRRCIYRLDSNLPIHHQRKPTPLHLYLQPTFIANTRNPRNCTAIYAISRYGQAGMNLCIRITGQVGLAGDIWREGNQAYVYRLKRLARIFYLNRNPTKGQLRIFLNLDFVWVIDNKSAYDVFASKEVNGDIDPARGISLKEVHTALLEWAHIKAHHWNFYSVFKALLSSPCSKREPASVPLPQKSFHPMQSLDPT